MPSISQKRLTAVLAAEAVTIGGGNSQRMQIWLGILSNYKTALASQIKHLGGNVIGRSHTAVLAEFSTIVHAVDCALKFQHSMMVRNRRLPPENRVFFRLGLHVGEIILGGGSLTGHGVQIAMQLGADTLPGGILISGQAYDLISNLQGEFEPTPALMRADSGPELRVYRKRPDQSLYFGEDTQEERAASDRADVTILDLTNHFEMPGDDTTIIGELPATVSQVGPEATANRAASELVIAQIEALLLQAAASAKTTDYYLALQAYEKARQLTEDLGQVAPESQSFYFDRLREYTTALENAFGFESDAVVESPNGVFVVRLATTLDIGRGREGAIIGCELVSRIGRQTRLSIEKNLFQITDLGSTNGTFVDGRCLDAQKTYTIPADQECLTIRLGGSRAPGAPGPVCATLTQIRGEYLALLLRYSPDEGTDPAQLSTAWPSMAADCAVTYVFSNGPVLIGNCDDCAVRLINASKDALAKMELTHRYQIAPQGEQPLTINRINFARPVVLSDRTDVEVQGMKFKIHARRLETVAN